MSSSAGLPIFVLVFTMVFNLSQAHAQEQTRALMSGALDSFVELIPYMHSEELLKNPQSREKIEKHLLNLQETFTQAEHVSALQTPSFMPSIESMQENINETVRAFRAQNHSFTLMRMNATTSLCISCHAQLPEGRSSTLMSAISEIDRNRFASDYEYADFLFMGRNYMRSVRYFERSIQKNLEVLAQTRPRPIKFNTARAEREIRSAMKRVLSTYTKINFRPSMARSFLEKFERQQGLPQMLRSDMSDWIRELKKWEQRSVFVRLDSAVAVENFIATYLDPILEREKMSTGAKDDVTLLVASGILTKFLSLNSEDPLAPRALYWLAKSERALNFSFFYSLADLYLRDCIKLYPKSDYARKCLTEYEMNIVYGYSGSAGVDIPEDELEKLRELEKIIEAANE